MTRAAKICTVDPNCGNLQPCPDHPKVAWSGSQRGERLRTRSGSRQQKLRRFVLDRDDCTCHGCGEQYLESQLVNDHVVPLGEGGDDHVDNMAPMCMGPGTKQCHEAKTSAEAQRGRERAR